MMKSVVHPRTLRTAHLMAFALMSIVFAAFIAVAYLLIELHTMRMEVSATNGKLDAIGARLLQTNRLLVSYQHLRSAR